MWYVGKWTKWANGFCFSPKFGGKCYGIPDPCESCRSVCGNRNGNHTTALKFGQTPPPGSQPIDCKIFLWYLFWITHSTRLLGVLSKRDV